MNHKKSCSLLTTTASDNQFKMTNRKSERNDLFTEQGNFCKQSIISQNFLDKYRRVLNEVLDIPKEDLIIDRGNRIQEICKKTFNSILDEKKPAKSPMLTKMMGEKINLINESNPPLRDKSKSIERRRSYENLSKAIKIAKNWKQTQVIPTPKINYIKEVVLDEKPKRNFELYQPIEHKRNSLWSTVKTLEKSRNTVSVKLLTTELNNKRNNIGLTVSKNKSFAHLQVPSPMMTHHMTTQCESNYRTDKAEAERHNNEIYSKMKRTFTQNTQESYCITDLAADFNNISKKKK